MAASSRDLRPPPGKVQLGRWLELVKRRKVENRPVPADTSGRLTDPFGPIREVATHQEDVSPEESQHRLLVATS
jgi:hypothetical protein